jgi:hypothetical protein
MLRRGNPLAMGTSRSLLVGRAISTIFSSIVRTISVSAMNLP